MRTAGAPSGRAEAPIEPGGVALTEEQRLAWLRLFRCENVGPAFGRKCTKNPPSG